MSGTEGLAPYTVVIPAFNAARTLADAIRSALAQTMPPAVIVVVDDGSSDGTIALATAFGERVTLISQHNRGPAAATDRGIAAAQTDLIAGLDADDVWFTDKAERQLCMLASRPDLDAVFCRAVSFLHGDAADPGGPARDLWGRSSMLIRRAVVGRIGPILDGTNPRGLGEMIRWIDTGRRSGARFEMMPDTLVGRRIIEGSLSAARDPASLLPMIRARLAQRR